MFVNGPTLSVLVLDFFCQQILRLFQYGQEQKWLPTTLMTTKHWGRAVREFAEAYEEVFNYYPELRLIEGGDEAPARQDFPKSAHPGSHVDSAVAHGLHHASPPAERHAHHKIPPAMSGSTHAGGHTKEDVHKEGMKSSRVTENVPTSIDGWIPLNAANLVFMIALSEWAHIEDSHRPTYLEMMGELYQAIRQAVQM
jgi:hypothetical protein